MYVWMYVCMCACVCVCACSSNAILCCIAIWNYTSTFAYIYICRIHIDAIIKTSEDFLKKIYHSIYLKGLCVRGSWRPNRTATYWPPPPAPPDLAVCRSPSPGLLNRGPGGPASLGFVLISASSHQLVSKLTGGPEGPFCWVVSFFTTSCF